MSDETSRPDTQCYEIRISEHLDQRWSRCFEGMEVSHLPDGATMLAGRVVDQAELQGILARIGDLGLTILLVRRVEQGTRPE